MQVRELRTFDIPDLADHVIHFTGRIGNGANLPPDIGFTPDQERLAHILAMGRVLGFELGGSNARAVCLTESTKAAVSQLIPDRRYSSCGVGFSKQFIFSRGGGPALYVRGDEWPSATSLPQPLRSRLVRFWPGAQPDPGETLAPHLQDPSEWLHEREWRVPNELRFGWSDVKFLIKLLHEAQPGWDYATGLGSPKVWPLAQEVVRVMKR